MVPLSNYFKEILLWSFLDKTAGQHNLELEKPFVFSHHKMIANLPIMLPEDGSRYLWAVDNACQVQHRANINVER